jgi:enoyl-CoA hydratase
MMRIEAAGELAILRMEMGKANAVGPAFLGALDEALGELERDLPRGIVLVGYDRYFSAGLDLPALLPLERGAMRDLITLFSRVMLRLFTLPRPVVAAVNGHAVAGGCVLALQADVRLMTDDEEARIGLKEAALGIGLPTAVIETLRIQVPAAALVPIALEARLFPPLEALELGLVDALAPSGELLARAASRARELGSTPPFAYAQIKGALRAPAAETIQTRGATEAERWLDTWFSEDARRLVGEAVAKLRR